MIPYGRQDINKDDIQAVVNVLESDLITQGPLIPRFELAVADYCGATYGVAVNSATSALHMACRALGLRPGDYLWTSPITFVASANCALYCGAEVDFVDVDYRTYNISIEHLEEKLVIAEKLGKLPKIVVPVHFAGQSCEMHDIAKLSKKYGFHVIEDASHAIGGKYQAKQIGSCTYSDMTIFSFHPVKIITTGEGGMIVTKNAEVFEKLQLLRSHGITRNQSQMIGTADGPWYYQQITLGYNYRMTDFQAALGLSQLQRLDEFIAKRKELASTYRNSLEDLPITLPWQHPDTASAWHLYVICLQQNSAKSKTRIFNELQNKGIGVNVHYIPVHLQPYYKKLGFKEGDFPISEDFYSRAMTIPLFPKMQASDQGTIIKLLRRLITS